MNRIPPSGKGVRVSLIIPCYNEESRLSGEKVLSCLKELGQGTEIVLIDDGSTDGTGEVIRAVAAKSPAVRTISLSKNAGKAEAVRAGMREAAGRGAEFVGFCDADFSTPPEEVARVFNELASHRSAAVAIATRNTPESENIERSGTREALSHVFSFISSFVLGKTVTDSQCGAKFFKNTPALVKALDEPFISRWGFDVEILGRLDAAGDTETVEVPLKSWRERLPSGVGMLSMAATLFEMAQINGDLKARRKTAGNKAGLWTEVALTVFVRMIPIYLLTFVLGKILFWEDYWVNPDAYYHMGVGAAYAEMGWLSDFPWLKYTVLGDSFPNVYFVQHLLLAFLYIVIPAASLIVTLKSAIVVTAFLQMLSFYLFLRKWKVHYAVIWVVVGITVSSNMIWHTIALKGITLFSILFPWIVDSLWSNNGRRAFTIGWLSTYVYVGFIILIPLAACRIAGQWFFDGKLKVKTPLLLFAGVALGMVLSPFFPDHLYHIAREIKTVFERPEFIQAGDFFGSEWSIPNRIQLQHFLGGMIILSLLATVFYMRRNKHCDGLVGSAFAAVFVFALLPFRGGIKFAQTFIVLAALMVPLIYNRISEVNLKIPTWNRRLFFGTVAALAASAMCLAVFYGGIMNLALLRSAGILLLALALAGVFVFLNSKLGTKSTGIYAVFMTLAGLAAYAAFWHGGPVSLLTAGIALVVFLTSFFTVRHDRVTIKPFLFAVFVFVFFIYSFPFIKQRREKHASSAPTPQAYEEISRMVRALTEKGKVVIAPWDDFPGLFYFNRDNYYVSGMNNLFLYHNDSHRFTSYYKFFKGGMENPAVSIPIVFDGADLILVRDAPRVEGETKLNEILENAPDLVRVSLRDGRFVEGKDVLAGYWRVYKIVKTPLSARKETDARP